MAITMTVGGASLAWKSGTLRITDNINSRSTARFTYEGDGTITVGSEVIITDGAVRIFAGTIHSFNKTVHRGTTLKQYDVTCVDYNQIADRRRVAETYTGETVSAIVNDIIATYLSEEGVTAGSIATGPIMKAVVFNYLTAAECLDHIQDATGLNWNIDYSKALNIFWREDSTGMGFTDALNNFMTIGVEETRGEYRNRQLVRAGHDKTDTITKEATTPKPDGVSRIFKTRYPVAEKPTIYVDDVAVAEGDVGIGGLESGKKWYWNKGSKDVSHDENEVVLSDIQTHTVTYKGLVPIIVQSDNPAEQSSRADLEGGTGLYENLEQLASVDDRDAALDYASGLLRRYADIPQIVDIETQEFRQAGTLVPVTVSRLDLDGEYLIESVNITERGGEMFYSVRCLSGESLGSWTKFFRKMREDSRSFVIRENEVLVLLTTIREQVGWTESVDQEIYACPVPATDLYPATTLYPC